MHKLSNKLLKRKRWLQTYERIMKSSYKIYRLRKVKRLKEIVEYLIHQQVNPVVVIVSSLLTTQATRVKI